MSHEIFIEPQTPAQRAWVADCRWLLAWEEEVPIVGRVRKQMHATDGMLPIWEKKLEGRNLEVTDLREVIRRELGLFGPPPPNLWQRITAYLKPRRSR